jgi:reactive chlorine resistance protein C
MEELMPNKSARFAFDAADLLSRTELPDRLLFAGRALALAGVVLPLFLIGILKFTQIEIDALKPLISGTPWLSWLHPVFGEAGASYLLGTVELFTVVLFVASPWSARAGVAAGALGTMIFAVTVSTMFALPIWEESLGGFPWLNALGQFLIKDVALLGVSIIVFSEGLARLTQSRYSV